MSAKNEKGIIELSWDELSLIAGGDCEVSPADPCGYGDRQGKGINVWSTAQGNATSYDESGGP